MNWYRRRIWLSPLSSPKEDVVESEDDKSADDEDSAWDNWIAPCLSVPSSNNPAEDTKINYYNKQISLISLIKTDLFFEPAFLILYDSVVCAVYLKMV